MTWRPLRERLSGDTTRYDTLRDGVPDYLRTSLLVWIMEEIGTDLAVFREIERVKRMTLQATSVETARRSLYDNFTQDPDLMFDVADHLLHRNQPPISKMTVGNSGRSVTVGYLPSPRADSALELKRMLDEAGSAWAVDLGAEWQIVRRVDETAQAAAEDVISRHTPASEHIAAAWQSCFKREPDYDNAYREAMFAVESVVPPLLTPKDPKPSLGKATATLRDTLEKWTVAGLDTGQPSAKALHAILETLVSNDRRHAAQKAASAPIVQADAEAVVFLAVALVQWFERGLVWRV